MPGLGSNEREQREGDGGCNRDRRISLPMAQRHSKEARMKRSTALFPILAALGLAACGGGGQSETKDSAEALEEAAEQSDPAAAAVLENAADAVREGNGSAQQALQDAGNAQAATISGAQQAPPSMQAQPNRTGQQTPPPKQPTGPAQEPHEDKGAGAHGNAH